MAEKGTPDFFSQAGFPRFGSLKSRTDSATYTPGDSSNLVSISVKGVLETFTIEMLFTAWTTFSYGMKLTIDGVGSPEYKLYPNIENREYNYFGRDLFHLDKYDPVNEIVLFSIPITINFDSQFTFWCKNYGPGPDIAVTTWFRYYEVG